jgi:hypothetical protein
MKSVNVCGFIIIIFCFDLKSHHVSCSPQKLTSCSAKLDSGQIIDLSSLDNPSNAKLFII